MLKTKDLSIAYSGATVVHDVQLHAQKGKITAIIGPNGAGKTTIMRAVSGLHRSFVGSVVLDGDSIEALPAHVRVKIGMALVPEGRHLFTGLTVEENLDLGGYAVGRHANAAAMRHVYELFPRLQERRHQLAGSLSGGEQQMLAIGRALMSRPRLLLLDEPSLGLAPRIVKEVFGVIKRLNSENQVTVVLVEQNVLQTLRLADYAYVLESGHITREGAASDLLGDPYVREAYLGL